MTKTTAKKIKEELKSLSASNLKIGLTEKYLSILPNGVDFVQNRWDVFTWHTKKGNRKTFFIDFNQVENRDLQFVAKIYVLDRRISSKLEARTFKNDVRAIGCLSKVLNDNYKIPDLCNADFFRAQDFLEANFDKSTPQCTADKLVFFGRWLNQNFGLRISYKNQLSKPHTWGRKGSDQKRKEKLIDLEVIRQLVASANNKNLCDADKLFLPSLTINLVCGFRVNEMSTLPIRPLVKSGNEYLIRYFAEKGGVLDVRPIPTKYVPVIKTALKNITTITEPGRQAVTNLRRELKSQSKLDWNLILTNEKATKYFTAKFAHAWTAKPMNNLFSKYGGWYEPKKSYIDAIGLIKLKGSQRAAANSLGISRSTLIRIKHWQESALRNELPLSNITKKSHRAVKTKTTWDTDSRVISMRRFLDYIDKNLQQPKPLAWAKSIIDKAYKNQLEGRTYPCPKSDLYLEKKYKRSINPVIEDKEGNAILEPENALFVLRKNELSGYRATKNNEYRLVDDTDFANWLSGIKEFQGTMTNKDSVFNRLDIIDPNTREIVKFTWHDMRHWLDSLYAEGGLSEEQIGLIFSRQPISNHYYDQTSSTTRLENLRKAVREDKSYGILQDNYNRIAEYNREEAESYLNAKTIMIRVMPHGGSRTISLVQLVQIITVVL